MRQKNSICFMRPVADRWQSSIFHLRHPSANKYIKCSWNIKAQQHNSLPRPAQAPVEIMITKDVLSKSSHCIRILYSVYIQLIREYLDLKSEISAEDWKFACAVTHMQTVTTHLRPTPYNCLMWTYATAAKSNWYNKKVPDMP